MPTNCGTPATPTHAFLHDEKFDLSAIFGALRTDAFYIGADSQPETALSTLAEAVAIRAGRDRGRLQTAKGRIHVGVE